jgi:hypothetical protein
VVPNIGLKFPRKNLKFFRLSERTYSKIGQCEILERRARKKAERQFRGLAKIRPFGSVFDTGFEFHFPFTESHQAAPLFTAFFSGL